MSDEMLKQEMLNFYQSGVISKTTLCGCFNIDIEKEIEKMANEQDCTRKYFITSVQKPRVYDKCLTYDEAFITGVNMKYDEVSINDLKVYRNALTAKEIEEAYEFGMAVRDKKSPHKCHCDKFTVVNLGCKCGGI